MYNKFLTVKCFLDTIRYLKIEIDLFFIRENIKKLKVVQISNI